jgi:hypothetical protein
MEMDAPSISKKSVLKGTGRSWSDWFNLLDGLGANDWSHKEIARALHQDHDVSGWWAQTITVEYERRIGRREIGQNCRGNFQGAASKTLTGSMNQIFLQWQNYMKNKKEVNGISFKEEPQMTISPKWRYWRVKLEDESKVSVIINQKDKDKVKLAVNHENLANAESVSKWKPFWKSRLQEFSQINF